MKTWESIFNQSPVNYGYYSEDALPESSWDWPKTTWFQARRQWLRQSSQNAAQKQPKNAS